MANVEGGRKKLVSQSDLRRLMHEKINKLKQGSKRIESPLAKYTSDNQLMCIVCNSVVRTEAVWTVHLNSKKHKENLLLVKSQKSDSAIRQASQRPPTPPSSIKRKSEREVGTSAKKLKGILKNSTNDLPSNFFDKEGASLKKNDLEPVLQKIKKASSSILVTEYASSDEDDGSDVLTSIPGSIVTPVNGLIPERVEAESKKDKNENPEVLPEGFFDDPKLDAKARNVEYKDPVEEEWEKFQRVIKEETTVSAQIIEEDQEEATAERQIDEIDEQMRNWTRVISLEKKKEEVTSVTTKGSGEEEESSSSADEAEFEEYLDWRAKKSYK